ncbi:MAG TPA: MarR family winged helix-turn-helix transcriptional regulator [Cyclobacteriaceae bacterium]
MNGKSIKEFRAFNRFYTSVVGLLESHFLNSRYSLVEVRIMYEIYYGKDITASDLIRILSIDKGYLSRIIRQFEKKKLIRRERSSEDTRVIFLTLTIEGRKEFTLLDKAQDDQVRSVLTGIPGKELNRLLANMSEIKRILTRK